jgi:hypothetical protein
MIFKENGKKRADYFLLIAVPSWSEQRRENRKGQRGLEGKKKPTRKVSGCVGLTQEDRCQMGGMIRVLQHIWIARLLELRVHP